MSDVVKVALISAIASIVAALIALAGLIISLVNRNKLQAVHLDLNGKLKSLLEITGVAEHARGLEEGRAQGVVEKAARVTEAERVEDREEQKKGETR